MKLTFLILAICMVVDARATFLPKKDLANAYISKGEPQITKEIFDSRVKELQETFSPIVAHFKGKLKINGQWDNKQINAFAGQMLGSWKVTFTGGLAKRPELSPDGMTLIICHEIGHHLGGFPFSSNLISSWAAVEGQADYFSTLVCARKMWQHQRDVNMTFETKVAMIPKTKCDFAFPKDEDRQLCYRTSVGLESVINTMAVLLKKPMPQYDTPDTKEVTETFQDHPAVQCRLDTLYHGAICPIVFDETIIPGKSTRGRRSGKDAEMEAALHSCTLLSKFDYGLRPACWYKANM